MLDAFQGCNALVTDSNLRDSIPLAPAEEIIIVLIKFCLDVSSEIGVREVEIVNDNGAIRDDNHVQVKVSAETLAAIVGVSYLRYTWLHLQGFAAHGAAFPFGGLGHVKPGECTQIKGAGGLFNIDVDHVVACIQ